MLPPQPEALGQLRKEAAQHRGVGGADHLLRQPFVVVVGGEVDGIDAAVIEHLGEIPQPFGGEGEIPGAGEELPRPVGAAQRHAAGQTEGQGVTVPGGDVDLFLFYKIRLKHRDTGNNDLIIKNQKNHSLPKSYFQYSTCFPKNRVLIF